MFHHCNILERVSVDSACQCDTGAMPPKRVSFQNGARPAAPAPAAIEESKSKPVRRRRICKARPGVDDCDAADKSEAIAGIAAKKKRRGKFAKAKAAPSVKPAKAKAARRPPKPKDAKPKDAKPKVDAIAKPKGCLKVKTKPKPSLDPSPSPAPVSEPSTLHPSAASVTSSGAAAETAFGRRTQFDPSVDACDFLEALLSEFWDRTIPGIRKKIKLYMKKLRKKCPTGVPVGTACSGSDCVISGLMALASVSGADPDLFDQ